MTFSYFRYDDNNDDTTDRPLVFKVSVENNTEFRNALAQLSDLFITERVGGLDKRTFVNTISTETAGSVVKLVY